VALADPPDPGEDAIDDPDKLNPDMVAKMDRTQRADAAVAMKVAGAPLSEIANVLGYASATKAREAIENALAASVGDEDRKQARSIAKRRLERLLRVAMKKALADGDDQVAFMRASLALVDRTIRLDGLDAPVEHLVYTPSAGEIEQWLSRASSLLRDEYPQEEEVVDVEVVEDEDDGPRRLEG
jgi:hypothetical protein